MKLHDTLKDQLMEFLGGMPEDDDSLRGFINIVSATYHRLETESSLNALKSAQDYRNILENSADIIYKAGKTGQFEYANPVAERITGYSIRELIGMHFTDLIKQEFRKDALAFYHKQFRTRKTTSYYEFPLITKSGDEIWIGQSVQLTGKTTGDTEFIALAIDITERKSYERSLFLQKEKYRNIIANMNLGLLEVDPEEQILYANQAFADISGYSTDELIGKNASQMFVQDSHADVIKGKIIQRSKGVSDMYELPVKNKSGETRWWVISGAPNYDEKGNLTGSIGIHLDITEKKELELQLEHALHKAEESARAKATFLANMSHEIRTPLNGIIGMIRELNYEKLGESREKLVKKASVASQHLLSVLNNILDISKIEAQELSLENHHFRLTDTIRDVKMIMSSKAREKGLFLGIDVHEIKNLTYIGDSSRIRQILLNLTGNAIKFTSAGGVYLEVRIREKKTNVHTISILVEDTGIGMSDDYQKSLFRKFSQEDASTSRKYGGTGLGMAISYELVQLMKGSINVKSVKDEGTVIEVTIDLPVGENEKAEGPVSAGKIDLSGTKILLVEDNEFNREVAGNTLRRSNCEVIEAVNGKEALELLLKHKFDLVLMDIQMPVMDGFETIKVIRNSLRLSVPVIALTANAFKSELEQCLTLGMNDCVNKPFEEEKLIAAIAKQLNLQGDRAIVQPQKADRSAEPSYNFEKLNSLGGNDLEYSQKLIQMFITQAELSIAQMREFVASADVLSISKVAHRIKPGIDFLDMHELKNIVRDIEHRAHLGENIESLTPVIETFIFKLGHLTGLLKKEAL